MTNIHLSPQELASYHKNGWIGPFTTLDPEEMALIGKEIVKGLDSSKVFFSKKSRCYQVRNRHLDLKSISLLCSHPDLVNRISDLFNSELVLWRSHLFLGFIGRGIPWHQDTYNTLLSDTKNHISAHLAINGSSPNNCLSFLEGSHKLSRPEEIEERYGFHLISESQKGSYGTPRYVPKNGQKLTGVRQMLLKPGEFVIFHPRLAHTSKSMKTVNFGQKLSQSTKWLLSSGMCAVGYLPDPALLRIGLGIRITTPTVEVLPGAWAETNQRADHCVRLAKIR